MDKTAGSVKKKPGFRRFGMLLTMLILVAAFLIGNALADTSEKTSSGDTPTSSSDDGPEDTAGEDPEKGPGEDPEDDPKDASGEDPDDNPEEDPDGTGEEPGEETDGGPAPSVTYSTALPEGFRRVAENGRFRMYIEDKEYNVAVEDIRSGSFWYTSPPERESIEGITGSGGLAAGSHMIVSYFDTSSQSAGSVNSLLGSVRQKSAKLTEIRDGVRIDFDFTREKEGFSIPLELVLTDTGFAARIIFEEINEYSEVNITNIALLPYCGTGTTADEGFLMIPDGSGAVVDFNSGLLGMSVYSREVYGRDLALTTLQKVGISEEILLPVYGIRKNGFGMVGYVSEGAGSTVFNASPAGIAGPLNYAYMSFCYRKTDNIVLADNTWTPRDVIFLARDCSQRKAVEMRYDLLGPDKADLGGMAEAYRSYLQSRGLTASAGTALNAHFSVYGAVKKQKYFLGIPYTSVQALTTYDQAREIAAYIRESTGLPLVMQYHGALDGGMDDAVPVDLTPEGDLGGKRGFRELLSDAERNGYTVLPDVEFLRISRQRFGWWFFQCGAKNISRQQLVENTYKSSVFFSGGYRCNLLAAHKLMPAMTSFLKSAAGYPLTGLSLSSLGNTVYSNFDSGHVADEDAMIVQVQTALQTVGETYEKVAVSGAADYAALYADYITDVPVSDSGYDIASYRVPFYQMVFSGYADLVSAPLNGSANYTNRILMCIETATAPNYAFTYDDTSELENTAYESLTSSQFEVWKEDACNAYKEFASVYASVADRRIVGYRAVSEKLRRTEFGDGTVIWVNYDTIPAVCGDVTVPARSYLVQNG